MFDLQKNVLKNAKVKKDICKILFIVDELDRTNGEFASEFIETITLYLGVEESRDDSYNFKANHFFANNNIKAIYALQEKFFIQNLPNWWFGLSDPKEKRGNWDDNKHILHKHFSKRIQIKPTFYTDMFNQIEDIPEKFPKPYEEIKLTSNLRELKIKIQERKSTIKDIMRYQITYFEKFKFLNKLLNIGDDDLHFEPNDFSQNFNPIVYSSHNMLQNFIHKLNMLKNPYKYFKYRAIDFNIRNIKEYKSKYLHTNLEYDDLNKFIHNEFLKELKKSNNENIKRILDYSVHKDSVPLAVLLSLPPYINNNIEIMQYSVWLFDIDNNSVVQESLILNRIIKSLSTFADTSYTPKNIFHKFNENSFNLITKNTQNIFEKWLDESEGKDLIKFLINNNIDCKSTNTRNELLKKAKKFIKEYTSEV